jgi:hypothetical protein
VNKEKSGGVEGLLDAVLKPGRAFYFVAAGFIPRLPRASSDGRVRDVVVRRLR